MRLSKLVIIALACCLASCATVEVADGIQCAPERDDVMVRLVDTLSRENVSPIEQVPADLSLQYRCEPAGSSECVWRIDEGEEDFKSTRLAKFHRNSNTLVLAEGQDEEFVVSRIGFAGQCVSLPTARPLYMASELSAEQLRDVFASPDKIYRYPNLLAGDGLVATLARDPSVYLKFARDWAASLLDDLAELIRF